MSRTFAGDSYFAISINPGSGRIVRFKGYCSVTCICQCIGKVFIAVSLIYYRLIETDTACNLGDAKSNDLVIIIYETTVFSDGKCCIVISCICCRATDG